MIAVTRAAITSSDVTRKLGIVKDTAVRELNELTEKSLLRKEGVGRATKYLPTEAGLRYFPQP